MSYGDNGNSTALAPRNERIENKIDRETVGQLAISNAAGGVSFQSVVDLMEFAKLMAISGICIPKHLRGEPGACLAICMQAVEWRMSPYAVANKSYTVNDRIAYESQLIHAVVEQRAPLVGRLRATYKGNGPSRQCIITGYVKGEDAPLVYESSTFETIQPKNSPLWKSKPDLQLFYNASRDWARMYFPDLILGVYSSDEIDVPQQPTARVEGRSRTAELAERFAQPIQHPTEPTQTIDSSTSNESDQSVDDRVAQSSTASANARFDQETDLGGVEADPPTELAKDLDTEAKFREAAEGVAAGRQISPSVFDVAMKALRVSHGTAGARRKDTESRNRVYAAMVAGKFDWNVAAITE